MLTQQFFCDRVIPFVCGEYNNFVVSWRVRDLQRLPQLNSLFPHIYLTWKRELRTQIVISEQLNVTHLNSPPIKIIFTTSFQITQENSCEELK